MSPEEVQKKLQELFEKLRLPQNQRNLTSEDEQFIKKLVKLYNEVKAANLTFSETVALYEKRVELANLEKVYYENEIDLLSEVRDIQENTAAALKREIMLLSSRELDEASKKELEQKKAFFLELKRATKVNNQIIEGFAKGEELTKGLVAATLGITKSYDFGPKSISAGVKGFSKGLAKALHPMNMIGTVITGVIEQLVKIDEARASLFEPTNLANFTDELIQIGHELRNAYGPAASNIAQEITTEAMRTVKSFSDIRAAGTLSDTLVLVGKMQKLGVSASAAFEINKFFNSNLGFTGKQSDVVLKQLLAQAKEMGRTPEEVFREMAESVPLYARFGANFPAVFRGIALAAKKTNISIADLQTLTESVDTTEDAMKKAAKFNALLGGEFLNGLQLLAADPGEKVKLISQAFKRAQAVAGDVNPRVLRNLYQEFGMDASSFQRMVGAEFTKFDEEIAAAPRPAKMAAIDSDIQKTLKAQDILLNSIQEKISKVSKLIAEFKPARDAINYITNNVETVVAATGILSIILGSGKFILGSRLRPKFISPSGPGGFGGPDGGGPVRRTPEARSRPAAGTGRGGYYDRSTGKFRDVYGREISSARAKELGIDRRMTRVPPRPPGDPPPMPGQRGRMGRMLDSSRSAAKSMFTGMRNTMSSLSRSVSTGLNNTYRAASSAASSVSSAARATGAAASRRLASAGQAISSAAQRSRAAVADISSRTLDKINSLKPVEQFKQFLSKVPTDKLAKVLRGAGILGSLLSVGSIAYILASDMPLEDKAKAIIRMGSGILGGIIGATAGALAGPLGVVVGGIGGGLLGDYIGSLAPVQAALLPAIVTLMPDLQNNAAKDMEQPKVVNDSFSPVEPDITPVTDGPSNIMSVAPTVKASFETSSDDDVLLKKLVMLKNNLEQIHNKGNNVNLTVGFNKIGTATVG